MCIPRMAARIVAGNVTVERLKKPTPRGLLRPDLDRTRCRSIVSSRKKPFLYGIHGRKVVASLKVARHGPTAQIGLSIHGRKVVASLKGWNRRQRMAAVVEYPRPKGRGLIEGARPTHHLAFPFQSIHGRKVVASLKVAGTAGGPRRCRLYPRPKGRGLIEGGRYWSRRIWITVYPRPKGRGLIEGLACAPGRRLTRPVSTAERSWPH